MFFSLLTFSLILTIAKHITARAATPIKIPAAMIGLNSIIPADKATAA
ncbi:MAG: hypothetical protein U0X86_000679 [Wolbachia endosymbiont of Xenopsylla cheopis]